MSGVANELLSGGVAGMVGILATQPMDTVRIRLQGANSAGAQKYTGIMDCLGGTLRNEGLRGLYKGVASPALTVGVMNAVLFFSYDFASRAIQASDGSSDSDGSMSKVFTAGCFSGLMSAFVTGPTELVKCIAQTNHQSKGLLQEEWHIANTMVKSHGVFGSHGPCRGLGLTILRDSPR